MIVERKERRMVARSDMPSFSRIEKIMRPTDIAQPRTESHVKGPNGEFLTEAPLIDLVSLTHRTEYSGRLLPFSRM